VLAIRLRLTARDGADTGSIDDARHSDISCRSASAARRSRRARGITLLDGRSVHVDSWKWMGLRCGWASWRRIARHSAGYVGERSSTAIASRFDSLPRHSIGKDWRYGDSRSLSWGGRLPTASFALQGGGSTSDAGVIAAVIHWKATSRKHRLTQGGSGLMRQLMRRAARFRGDGFDPVANIHAERAISMAEKFDGNVELAPRYNAGNVMMRNPASRNHQARPAGSDSSSEKRKRCNCQFPVPVR